MSGSIAGVLEAGTSSSSCIATDAAPAVPRYSTEVVSFAIGQDQYGVDIMAVREIKGWADVTVLPGQSDYIRGVLNLRGVIVPILDLRCRFGLGCTEATPLHIVIIVQVEERITGLLADRVLDIVPLDGISIKAVPRTAQSARVNFLLGLVPTDIGMVALINLPDILSMQTGAPDDQQ